MAAQNYTLGRGKVYFSRFKPGTQDPEGYRYIGNTPEFSLTIDSDTLDHFSSDEGIKEKDDSVPLSVSRTGSLTTDNVNPKNIALFFFGSDEIVTQVAVASAPYPINDVQKGHFYRIGQDANNPVGLRGLDPTGLTVALAAGGALAEGTDYRINTATGTLEVLETGTIANGADIVVTAAVLASTRGRVLSGSAPVEGALLYEANNPKGENFDYTMPYVKITPNGDYALKGDEWQTIPFNIEALKPNSGGEAIYVDGRPLLTGP